MPQERRADRIRRFHLWLAPNKLLVYMLRSVEGAGWLKPHSQIQIDSSTLVGPNTSAARNGNGNRNYFRRCRQ